MDEATKQFILTENEKLATMVAKGFAAIHETMATKEEMREGFAEVYKQMDQRFDAVETHLTRIEESVEYHGADIARLTDNVRILKTTAGIM